MEHLFVTDTNLFFECKRLEDISWLDLGVDPVVLVLTKPVIGEIDKHKKSGGRTRKRALAISGRIRDMLKSRVSEAVVRKAAPRVTLRLAPIIHPDPALAEVLDYEINDDRIVGIVSTISKKEETASVCFLTDDSVAASTAHSVGVNFRLIDDEWKRPPEQTTEAKRIKELEKDLSTYRAQEPSIVIENRTDEAIGTKVVRRVALPLTSDQVKALVNQLQARHPLRAECIVPEPERWDDGTKVTYQPPESEDVDKYVNEAYPDWLSKCRSILERLHQDRVEMERSLTLTLGIANDGTRPAIQVRIGFVAKGSIRICRRSEDDENENDRGNTSKKTRCHALPPLPPPPKPPQVQRIVKRPQLASGRTVAATVETNTSGLRIGDLARIGSVGTVFPEFSRAANVLGTNRELVDSMLGGTTKLEALDIAQSLDIVNHYKSMMPTKHDKEVFYYDDWPTDEPVISGALTCDLYRHKTGEKLFEVDVLFPPNGNARGAVVCTVHAENLTEPVSIRIPVSRCIEEYSLLEQAQALVNGCGDQN